MTRFLVLPYMRGSEGAKMLAEGLGGQRILLTGSRYEYDEDDCLINWGNGNADGHVSSEAYENMLNANPIIAINKRSFFDRFEGTSITPPFATTQEEARRHLTFPVVCRTQVEGADGQGIVIANTAAELVSARLYTQLMAKSAEYRVHMGRLPDGTVELICAQKKRVSTRHLNGSIWTGEHVFLDWCDPVGLPTRVLDVTKRAMLALPELTFGGFDVIDTDNGGARVVEVNSAPMQTDGTVAKYVTFFNRYVALRNAARTPVLVPVNIVMEEAPSAVTDEEVNQVFAQLFNNTLSARDVVEAYVRSNR